MTAAGGVKCWGANGDGQLGDATNVQRWTPTDVAGLGSGVAAISASYRHTCAVTASGGARCWGYNAYGQLGDGTTTSRVTRADVVGLSTGVKAISAGVYHTCALSTTGGVKCWGYNVDGELGDGTTTDRWTPVGAVGLGSGVSTVSTGGGHTCALTAAGAAVCWGYNGEGQVGDGTGIDRLTPVNVSGLTSGVKAIDAGLEHTCAQTATGDVRCWGFNGFGQIGDGTTTDRLTPVSVVGLP